MYEGVVQTFRRGVCVCLFFLFFFEAEDGIRDLVRSRGLGDVYKRQAYLDVDGGQRTVGWPGGGCAGVGVEEAVVTGAVPVSYTHLTPPTIYPV